MARLNPPLSLRPEQRCGSGDCKLLEDQAESVAIDVVKRIRSHSLVPRGDLRQPRPSLLLTKHADGGVQVAHEHEKSAAKSSFRKRQVS